MSSSARWGGGLRLQDEAPAGEGEGAQGEHEDEEEGEVYEPPTRTRARARKNKRPPLDKQPEGIGPLTALPFPHRRGRWTYPREQGQRRGPGPGRRRLGGPDSFKGVGCRQGHGAGGAGPEKKLKRRTHRPSRTSRPRSPLPRTTRRRPGGSRSCWKGRKRGGGEAQG